MSPSSEPLSPTEALIWRAFVVIWRLGLPQFDRTFRRHSLVHLEFGILAVLMEQQGGTCTPTELAELAGVSPSRLSHRLKAMSAKGLINREGLAHDARIVTVSITSKGRRVVDAIAEEHRRDIRRVMIDPLTPEQQAHLADALGTIASRLTTHPFLSSYRK